MYVLIFLSIILAILVVSLPILYLRTIGVEDLIDKNPVETAFMSIRDRQFNYPPSERKQTWVSLSQISPYLVQSIIASEDRNFLIHQGFYWEEIWYSMLKNIENRRFTRGGSSITQQLAKNLYLTPSRTIVRKLKEAIITYKLERELTKTRILEIYLNVIEWGENIYGAEEACRHYFKKSASELSLTEAIRLTVCVPNPRAFAPNGYSNGYLESKQKQLLFTLWKHGWISRPKFMQTLNELETCQKAEYKPPVLVPFEQNYRQVDSPEFWIENIQDSEELLMSGEEIAAFNQRAGIIGGGIDINHMPVPLSVKEIRDKIIEVSGFDLYSNPITNYDGFPDTTSDRDVLSSFETLSFFDRNNKPLKTECLRNVLRKMNIGALKDGKSSLYAVAVDRTGMFKWPEDIFVMNKPYDYEFNRLQLSSLNATDTVAVIHMTIDRQWSFVRTRYVDGWVKTGALAFADAKVIRGYPGERFLVVTRPGCRTESGIELQAGARVPFKGKHSDCYRVLIPSRHGNGCMKLIEDTIPKEYVHEGYMPYTKKNVIKTAFAFSGKQYSLGGYGGGVDCSSFIQSIFSVFGFDLPRNSSAQAAVGNNYCKYENPLKSSRSKIHQVRNWEPGITLLRFPGHVMLYLGEYERQAYAMHAVWGVSNSENKIMHINKVSVTDLGLGRGSQAGSLHERITDVSTVMPIPSGFRSLIEDFVFALDQHPWNLRMLSRVFIFMAVVIIVVAVLI